MKPPVNAIRSLCRVVAATVFSVLAFSSIAAAQSATLAWNANTEPDLAGYRVEFGTVSGSPTTTVDVGNVTQRQFTGLQAGVTYYFRVKAYNTANLESAPSSEVSHTPPVSVVPTLTSISPTSGPSTGGTIITLTGTNFVSGATVRVNGVAATGVTFVSATQVRATTPAGSAGAAHGADHESERPAASLAAAFTVTSAARACTSVSPTSGPHRRRGTTITITGTQLRLAARRSAVPNGVAATGVTFLSATAQQLAAQLRRRAGDASRAAERTSVQVTNPDGQSATLAGAFTYTASTPPPTLTAVSPASGPTTGGTAVTLTGTNFAAGATVTIGGTAATSVVVASATSITAVTPAGAAGARDVRVTSGGQSVTRTGGFTYTTPPTPSPTLSTVSPVSGPAAGGTAVTLSGTNFAAGATVSVGGAAATSVVVVSSTRITAVTPAGAAGARDVRVTLSGGQSATLTGGFTYTTGTSTDSDGDGLTDEWETLSASTRTPRRASTAPPAIPTRTALSQRRRADGRLASARHAQALPGRGRQQRLLCHPLRHRQPAGERGARPADVRRHERAAPRGTTLLGAGAERSHGRHDHRLPRWRRLVRDDAGGGRGGRARSPHDLGRRRGYAAHMETAVEQPATIWYFAEGATHGAFDLFYLIQNPSSSAAAIRVRYLRRRARRSSRPTALPAGSRFTIWVDQEDGALQATDVSAEITSTNGVPIIVERSMYLNTPHKPFKGGHNSAGVTSPSLNWFLAEGSTGSFFSMYVLMANPNATAATVRATYILRQRRAHREDLHRGGQQPAHRRRLRSRIGRWPTPPSR